VQSGDNPLADYMASLRKMEGLEVDLILPAHENIFQGLKRRIGEILSHHRERNAAIMAALGDGPQTACGVSRQIPWNVPGQVWEKFSPLDKRGAVTETLAHLEWLRGEGLVERSQKDGFEIFQASILPGSSES
ncbi:MAG: hypothetical protein ACE5IA_04870, partial [Dehalococcoidia bacterium]